MEFPDYVIFGTGAGLFAEGAGQLSGARRYLDIFEIRTPRDAVQLVPGPAGISLLRRPIVSENGKSHHELLAAVISATDLRRRKGFLAVGVLLEEGSAAKSYFEDAQVELLDMLGEASGKYLDEDNVFLTGFEPPIVSGDMSAAARAKIFHLLDDNNLSAYRIDTLDSDDVVPGGALYTLSKLRSNERSTVIITSDPHSEFPQISEFDIAQAEDRLRDEEIEARLEIQSTVTSAEISALAHRIEILEKFVTDLRQETSIQSNNGYVASENIYEPIAQDMYPEHEIDEDVSKQGSRFAIGRFFSQNSEQTDFNDPRFENEHDQEAPRTIRLFLVAFLGTLAIIAVAGVLYFIFAKEPNQPEQSSTNENELEEIELSCGEFVEVLENSSIPGIDISDKADEFRSCIRQNFEGPSNNQAECSGNLFADVASEFWEDGAPMDGRIDAFRLKADECLAN